MRDQLTQSRRVFGAFTIIACGLYGTACFSPDLPEKSFLCAKTGKKCPDSFQCDEASQICVPKQEGNEQDAGVIVNSDFRIENKDGPVFLDGAGTKPSSNCKDENVEGATGNNTRETATELTGAGLKTDWEICYPGDLDHYAIRLEEGQGLTVDILFAHRPSGDLDAVLMDPKGFVVYESRSEDNDEQVVVAKGTGNGLCDVPSDCRSGDCAAGQCAAATYTLVVYGIGESINTYDLFISKN